MFGRSVLQPPWVNLKWPARGVRDEGKGRISSRVNDFPEWANGRLHISFRQRQTNRSTPLLAARASLI